jgi:predicted transcriptional regulator
LKSKNKIMDAAAQLIKDPRFLHRARKKIAALGMVGEVRNVLIVFLACLTLILKRKVSLIVTGPSSSGKSTVLQLPLKLFPPELVITRASFSRRAMAYGKEPLDDKILYVNEYRGGKEAQLLLRILQSEGEIAHEYTAGGKTEVTQRLGSPVVLTTTTEENIFEDDATRFLTIQINETSEQNLAVFKAEISPRKRSEEPKLEVWRQAIRLLKDSYDGDFPFPSWFEYVAEQVPRDKVRSRRDWKRFLSLIQAIALCRSQGDGNKEITFADYCVAYRIFNSAFTATAYTLNENELDLQKAVIRLHKQLGRAVTTKEIREELGWQESMTYKFVRKAVNHKLVQKESGTQEKNVKRFLPVPDSYGTFLPSPKKVLDNAEELGQSIKYLDPFTGEWKTVNRNAEKVA